MYLSGKLNFDNDLQCALKAFLLVSNSVLISDLASCSFLWKEVAFMATGSACPNKHPLTVVNPRELYVRMQDGRLDSDILLRKKRKTKYSVLRLFATNLLGDPGQVFGPHLPICVEEGGWCLTWCLWSLPFTFESGFFSF